METATHFIRPDNGLYSAITPEPCMDSGSTDLDESLGTNMSPGLSDDLYGNRNISQLKSSVNDPSSTILPSLLDKSADGQWNLIKVPVGFDVTRKGERSLVIGGYKFTKSRDGMGGRVFWRCSRRECKATAVTVANRVQHVRAIHSHQPPVAAEFFADDSNRSEQEVRFSSTTSGQQSRMRRRSQPNLPKSPSPTDSDLRPEGLVYSHSFPSRTQPQDDSCPQVIDHLKPEPSIHNHLKNEQLSSPEKKRYRSESILSEGLTAHALSTLLAKLVDSRQIKSAQPMEMKCTELNGVNIANEFHNVPTTDASSKFPISSKPLTTTEVRQTQSLHTKLDTTQNQTYLSGLEQLATLATSFASTPARSLELEAHHSIALQPPNSSPTNLDEWNCPGISQLQLNSTYPSSSSHLTTTTVTPTNATVNVNLVQQALSNPATVGLVGRNSQGQIILLSRDQLAGLIRPLRRGSNDLPSMEIETTTPTSNTTTTNSSSYLTERTDQFSNGYCQDYASVIYPGNLDSISDSSSLDHSDPPRKHMAAPQIADSFSLKDCPYSNDQTPTTSSLNESHSGNVFTFVQSETTIPNQDHMIPNGNSSTIKTPSTPNLLVHWKKEKIRESTEEVGATHAMDCTETSDLDDSYKIKSDQETRDNNDNNNSSLIWENHPSVGLDMETNDFETNDRHNSRMICCCSATLHDPTLTSDKLKQNGIYVQSDYSLNNRKISSSPENDEEDNAICTQIQDVVLVKVLSTVQQLTAKLDGDADPPEVIQNCQAIQACLDTIAAIKRARSAGSLTVVKSQSDSLQSHHLHNHQHHHPFPLGSGASSTNTTTITDTSLNNMNSCSHRCDSTLLKFGMSHVPQLSLGQASVLQPLQQYH